MAEETQGLIVLNPDQRGIGRYLNDWQVKRLRRPTPKSFIRTRPDGFNYVPGYRFRDELDFLFAGMWSFTVIERWRDGDDVIVHGRMTIHIPLPNGTFFEIKKDQFGTDHIEVYGKQSKRAGEALSIGNNYKAAATDAEKKCAVEFGIFRDVYMKQEDAAQRQAEIDAANAAQAAAAKGDAAGTFGFNQPKQ